MYFYMCSVDVINKNIYVCTQNLRETFHEIYLFGS